MNKELIQKFLNKACWDEQAQQELEDWLNVQKFAELIVRECMSMCKTAVGNRDYNTGRMHCYDNIKQHFGVEE